MIALSIKAVTIKVASLILACLLSVTSYAAIDVYDFDSVQQEAPIAQDLKQKTYDMVKDGRSDGEIRAYMQERYGDFISYKPPVRPSTWILWFFPPLLLIVLLIGWFWQSRRHQLVASGQSRVTVDNTASELTAAEKAELDRLLSRANSTDNDAHDTTSPEDKK